MYQVAHCPYCNVPFDCTEDNIVADMDEEIVVVCPYCGDDVVVENEDYK